MKEGVEAKGENREGHEKIKKKTSMKWSKVQGVGPATDSNNTAER
jgi:hypothetical protein